jgi:hypothetical protein
LRRTGIATFATVVFCAFIGVAAAAAVAAAAPSPAPSPTLDPHPQGSEVAFVTSIQKDLMARYPTSADAIKAGYFRYGNEDETGAISYANLQWQSSSPRHPSQLWYDAKGRLLGADFSVLQSVSASSPHLWGVNAQRWSPFPAHIHYILVGPKGDTYGYFMTKTFEAAGGDVTHPTAVTVVKLGKATGPSQVKRVFLFPSLWDLIVWVKPNPNGAFADKNPNVTPSANAGQSM